MTMFIVTYTLPGAVPAEWHDGKIFTSLATARREAERANARQADAPKATRPAYRVARIEPVQDSEATR